MASIFVEQRKKQNNKKQDWSTTKSELFILADENTKAKAKRQKRNYNLNWETLRLDKKNINMKKSVQKLRLKTTLNPWIIRRGKQTT